MDLKKINNIVKHFLPNEDVIAFSINNKGLINQTFVVSVGKKTKKFILQAINTTVFPRYNKGLINIILVKNQLDRYLPFLMSSLPQYSDKYICIEGVIWRLTPIY